MADLKPCPFCGDKAQLEHEARTIEGSLVKCKNVLCGASGAWFSKAFGYSSDDEAIAAWNRRAERVGKWEAVGKDLICSECKALKCASYPYFNYCPNCGARMKGEEDDSRRSD